MVAFLVSAVALGIAFSAPPGAVSAEVWRRGLAGGFRPAFLVEAGSLVGDAVWAIVALLGAAVIVESAAGRITLGIVGATVLMTLALKALAAAYRPKRPPAGHIASGRGHFTTGAAISLTNPYAVAFWAGAGAGVSGVLADGGREDLGLFFAGFMLGALLWALFVSVLVGWAHRRTGPRLTRSMNLLAAPCSATSRSDCCGGAFEARPNCQRRRARTGCSMVAPR